MGAMSLITMTLQEHFTKIRNGNSATKSDFARLFSRPINDQWPLQHRTAEYDFLKSFSQHDRDIEILRYSIQCWRDVQECSKDAGYRKKYVCCITFDSEDLETLGMLWPELYFFNSNLEPLSRLTLTSPRSSSGIYIRELVAELNLTERISVLEESVKERNNIKIYIDFDSDQSDFRSPLLVIARGC